MDFYNAPSIIVRNTRATEALNSEILIDVLIEFASMDDANRFIAQWS